MEKDRGRQPAVSEANVAGLTIAVRLNDGFPLQPLV